MSEVGTAVLLLLAQTGSKQSSERQTVKPLKGFLVRW